jgi:hypothetical protein
MDRNEAQPATELDGDASALSGGQGDQLTG